jgi:tetratricopeptide (TPR) repeat protein
VHWAHRVKDRFPGGAFYADLRCYGPGQPADSGRILDGFLAALDVAPARIPADLDAKAMLYRSLLDGRDMLVVLDNASTPQQVRPLLPGSARCLVLITSRTMLAGLAARNQARRISLDVLPIDDAIRLLTDFAGADRIAAEPDAARELALLCACLPVALCVAGERATARSATTLANLVVDLRQRRLDVLDADGDPETAVRTIFSWSYDALLSATARMFRLLGLHPGQDFDVYAAAALAGTDLPDANRLLDTLIRSHLIQEYKPGRYRMHDLLRAYAAEHAIRDDTEAHRCAALTRLFDAYLAIAAAAMDTLVPAEKHRRPAAPSVATPLPAVDTAAAARAWLDAERSTLVGVAEHAAAHGWPTHAIRLSTTLYRYLETGGHHPDAIAIHTCAVRAAQRAVTGAAEAYPLVSLGGVHARQANYAPAADHFARALAAFRDVGDRHGEARALVTLGSVASWQGHYRRAADHFEAALGLYREIGEAAAMTTLGIVYLPGPVRAGRGYPAARTGADPHARLPLRRSGDADQHRLRVPASGPR